jgi:hypothetical protein
MVYCQLDCFSILCLAVGEAAKAAQFRKHRAVSFHILLEV